jgi:hypothetical protein
LYIINFKTQHIITCKYLYIEMLDNVFFCFFCLFIALWKSKEIFYKKFENSFFNLISVLWCYFQLLLFIRLCCCFLII